MSCPTPLNAATLADYWLELLPKHEEEALEEHLFACEDCNARFSEINALADGIRELARNGSLRMVVSETFLERASAEGLRVRQYAPPRGGKVDCTVTLEDDLLIGRLAADFSESRRIDLAICNGSGVEMMRMADIPFRPGKGTLLLHESITRAKAAPSEVMIARLVAVDDAGVERTVGEYTFNHTRTIPGPPGW
jgi:hypothetical protein